MSEKFLFSIIFVALFSLVVLAGFPRLTGYDTITATVLPKQIVTGTVQSPLTASSTTSSAPTVVSPAVTATKVEAPPKKDQTRPTLDFDFTPKEFFYNESAQMSCTAQDDVEIKQIKINITLPNGTQQFFESEFYIRGASYRFTDVGTFSFVCYALDTSNNAAVSQTYPVEVLPKIETEEKELPTNATNTTAPFTKVFQDFFASLVSFFYGNTTQSTTG